LLKQKKDTENKLEALEEKFISGDIEKGLFENSVRGTPLLSQGSEENKNGRFIKNGQKSHWVVPASLSSNFMAKDLLSILQSSSKFLLFYQNSAFDAEVNIESDQGRKAELCDPFQKDTTVLLPARTWAVLVQLKDS
jgi:hypothetical protein